MVTPNADEIQHRYAVRVRVRAECWWALAYVPWCECGWVGVETDDETEANVTAYRHATLKDPEPDTQRRHRGPRQTEAIFDAREFDR